MGTGGAGDAVVASPTYMADIRFFFRQEDIDHMGAKGIDLGTYAGVKKNAVTIYTHTGPPNPDMPPDVAGKWSADRVQTFKNWIVNGCPEGAAVRIPLEPGTRLGALPGEPAPERVRKNVTALDESEIETLKTAFTGLMGKDPSDATSYFALAAAHGLPGAYCLHHEDRFNPWHRVYIKSFEDALRSVPGCEALTLPYWDFLTPLPALLQQPPFDKYVLQKDPGGGYFPYTTQRYAPGTITANMNDYGVPEDVTTSLAQSVWGAYNTNGYQDYSIQAHDGGHVSTGQTMGNQDVASYDPVFWFYHCNIDRLWLDWQQRVGALTLTGFKSTLGTDTGWLEAPFNVLPPYATTADQTIAFGIAYDEPPVTPKPPIALANELGSIEAVRSFVVKSAAPVSVRVKGIDRLNIPGSFVVNLLADGEPIAKRAFFQPANPRGCENCAKNPLVNIDFRVGQDKLLDKKLSVEIDVPDHEGIGTSFPLAQAGNPTVNARLLLEDA